MTVKRGIAIILAVSVIISGIFISNVLVFGDNTKNTNTLSFSDDVNSESQFWQLETADYSTTPKYYLKNIQTNAYLMFRDGQLISDLKTETNIPISFEISGDKSGYYFSCDNGSLTSRNNKVILSGGEKFCLIKWNKNKDTSVRGNGTYKIALKSNRKVLTDNGKAYYTVSKYADEYAKTVSQKWRISKAGIIKGVQYYYILSLDSKRWFSVDDKGAALTGNKSLKTAYWRFEEIPFSAIPASAKAYDSFKHYYKITNSDGKFLCVNKNGEFCTKSNVKMTPSNVFVIEEGNKFVDNGTVHIANLGGDGGEYDRYDENCRRFLQCVTNGNEISLSLQSENKQNNQKWEITYISSEDRTGKWYRYHYYTIRNCEFDMYLTVRNGSLMLCERDETDDYQLWNLFDMMWGWTSSTKDNRAWSYHYYSVINKGAGLGIVSKGFRLSLETPEGGRDEMGGQQGAIWMFDGGSYDLKHEYGNNDPSKLVKSAMVTMLGYEVGVYLEANGPDVPVEGSIHSLYISNSGNDKNNGLSAKYPIKTIAKAQKLIEEKTIAKKGHIYFNRGDTFTGNLELPRICGRERKYIYFEAYGNEKKANPNIVSNNKKPALKANNCYCVSISDIDFTGSYCNDAVVLLDDNTNFTLSRSTVIGNKQLPVSGIKLINCGSKSNSDCSDLSLSELNIIGCNVGINFIESGGISFGNSQVVNSNGNGIRFENSENIDVNNVKTVKASSNGDGAVYISGSKVNMNNCTVKSTLKGNAIEYIGKATVNSTVNISDSAIAESNGKGLYVVACDKEKDENGNLMAATDSLVLDNVVFYDNSGYDLLFEKVSSDSSNLASTVMNSTFVKDKKTFYPGYKKEISGVILHNNVFMTKSEYVKMRNNFKDFVKKALAKRKGATSDDDWESYQNILISAIEAYNKDYLSKNTVDTVISSLSEAMKTLVPESEPEKTDSKTDVREEITEISIEEAVTKMITDLAKTDDEVISIKVSEDFIFTVDMQKIVAEAGKKIKITFTDEEGETLYQWFFETIPCEYDINLKVTYESDNADAIKALSFGQIVSVKHNGALPTGTKLIVLNRIFEKRENFVLKAYDEKNNELTDASNGYGESFVAMSNDNEYLQLCIERGGDYIIEPQTVKNKDSGKIDSKPDYSMWVYIGISAGAMLLSAGIFVFIILSKKRRKNKQIN